METAAVLVPRPEPPGGFRLAARIRIVRAVNPVERTAEIHRVRAERIVRIAALHVPRHIFLPRDHLRRRRPIWIFFFRGDLVRALPLEAGPANTDSPAQRRAAALNEIKPPLCRVDDDGAWRILTLIARGGAAEAGAIEAKDVVDALPGCAAAQQLAVGLGLRETDGTQPGGDCSYGRNMTYQHDFPGWKWCGTGGIKSTVSPMRRQLAQSSDVGAESVGFQQLRESRPARRNESRRACTGGLRPASGAPWLPRRLPPPRTI